MTTVLGIYTGHDQSACLVRDGKIVVMIEEERLTRVKNGLPKSVRGLWSDFNGRFGYFPWASMSYCLDASGLGIDELDAIVLPEMARDIPMGSLLPIKDRRKVLISSEPRDGEHHYRHALSAFFASPFERAAVLIADGDGSRTKDGYEAETGYLFMDRRGAYREIFKNRYPSDMPFLSGLGWTYDYVSAVLGFVNTQIGYLSEPGKTMGLAPYGRLSLLHEQPWIKVDGFKLDFSSFHEWLVRTGLYKLIDFEDTNKALIQNTDAISADAKDLAFKVQAELEEALFKLAVRLHKETGAQDLCLAGGVALNSVANGRILENGPFDRVFVQPAAADNGQAIGLAFHGYLELAAHSPIEPIRHAFGGRSYPRAEVRSLLLASGLLFQEFEDTAALTEDVASELAEQRIVGWFQGGSEYGPRALGHRSILADPRSREVRDHLNAHVKFREPFRPFAPSVLLERASEVFDLRGESPYMLIVAKVREAWRQRVPAITHIDGTARIQTVDPAVDPLYHALICAFEAKTNVPLLLNTSFNLRGMPIVETPRDALQCFLYTDMHALYIECFKILRPGLDRIFPHPSPGWRFVVEHELSWTGSQIRARYETGEKEKKRIIPVQPVPGFAPLCARLDGRCSLADAIRATMEDDGLSPEAVASCVAVVLGLFRRGAMRLRVGSIVL